MGLKKYTIDATTANRVLINFIFMSTILSFNHGVVSTLVAFASKEFSDMGGLTNGVLYIVYTITAVTVSPLVVSKLGAKWTLVVGLLLCCTYTAMYYFATRIEDFQSRQYTVFMGSFLGGLGSGVMWTAHGQYFQCSSLLYSRFTKCDEERATGLLAGIFTAIYLGLELAIKLSSSTIPLNSAFQIYLWMTVAITGLIVFIDNLHPAEHLHVHWFQRITSALKLLGTDRNAIFLLPTNFAFGFGAAMMQYYANKSIVPINEIDPDKSNIGYAASIAVGSGALSSALFGKLTGVLGKHLPIVIGNLFFMAVATSFIVFSQDQLSNWSAVAPLYCMYGIGRGMWEGVNKALYADVFPKDTSAAFANVTFQSGFASSIAFFIFPSLHQYWMATFVIVAASCGIPGVLVVRQRQKRNVYHDPAETRLLDSQS